ncbi:MAG: hypothetical protein K6F86_11900 [Lachnospiraceae bacterium]|nr:hypothetical protein [Lachnospiraceae bacterium]
MTYECIGKKTGTPFYIEQLGLNVYSFEELLYFLKGNAYILDDSVINEVLFDFIGKELELPDLHAQLKELYRKNKGLSDYVCTILAYGHYVNEEELENIRRIIEGNTDVKPFIRRKARGDFFFQNKNHVAAAEEYRAAISECDGSDRRLISVYHNLGMIYAGSYLFRESSAYFRKEWELSEDRDALKRYLKVLKIGVSKSEFEEEVLKTDPDPEVFEMAKEEIEKAETEAGNEVSALMDLQYQDRVGFIRKAEEMILELKNEYRVTV